ncbi:MAG: type III secretion system inner membrane ring subunit SctD [Chromatiales bacterium]|nr:type III secretion system inner membrane ring subunit SctD [Chromatiales bacterium]
MNSNKAWLLKVLTGPHIGSEAMLSSGSYVIGSDDDCDIILHDSSLSGRHFQLTLDTDKIILNILAQDHPCYIDGEEVASDDSTTVIEPYQVISSGTFFFTLGFVDKTWPPIELLGAGQNFKQEAAHTTKAETTQEVIENADEKLPPLPLMLWQKLSSNYSSVNRIHLLVGISLISIAISMLLIVLTTSDVHQGNLETETVEINELIETHGLDATVETIFVDGQKNLSIQGYAKTEDQRQAFMEALGKAGISARTQLYSADKLHSAILVILEQVLNAESDEVKVSAVPGFPGKVILSGYVEDSNVWQNILDTIKTDVPGLQDYDDRVWTMDDAVQALEQMLADQNLSEKVVIDRLKHTIYLTVHTLSEAEQQRLEMISENYKAKYDNKPQLMYQEQGTPPVKQFELDVVIQSVSFGQLPYLQTDDGNRYITGGIIGDGYTIKEINQDFILLLKAGELGRYYFLERPQITAP